MATSVFAGDSREPHRAMAEMNITPLVDVMLVLLIIFMVAAPMVTRSLDLRLPQATPPTQEEKPPHVELRVEGEGSFVLDGVLLSERGLAAALGDAARAAPGTVLEVRVDGDADYQAFTTALATARRSGLTNIAMQQ
jgi:biopolymer transport protein ExbD